MVFKANSNMLTFGLIFSALCAFTPISHASAAVLNAQACTLSIDGKTFLLHGKYQVVESFPDFKVEIVSSFSDLKVQKVSSFPSDCGQWQEVSSFPDFKIQFVSSFADLKITFVDSFPGVAVAYRRETKQ